MNEFRVCLDIPLHGTKQTMFSHLFVACLEYSGTGVRFTMGVGNIFNSLHDLVMSLDI